MFDLLFDYQKKTHPMAFSNELHTLWIAQEKQKQINVEEKGGKSRIFILCDA